MFRIAITLFFLSIIYEVSSQSLVANGGLNERNTCTEFRAQCAPEAWFFIPTYIRTSQTRAEGDYFEEVSMGTVGRHVRGSRNYIYTKILCTLKSTHQYRFSIWVNTGGNPFHHLDIYLSNDEPGRSESTANITEATFSVTPANEDSSLNGWKKYTYLFTAKGGERFLLMGNFSSDGMSRSANKVLSTRRTVLYAIDDLALLPVDTTEGLCPEYSAILKQVYDQNYRHPSRFVEDVEIERPLLKPDTVRKPEVTWVIVDTPPSLQKTLNDTLTIPDVLFLFNSSKLNPAFIKDLNVIIDKLKDKKFSGLEITGHTDNKGTEEYNIRLSLERASAIKDFLVKKLELKPEIVPIKGMGEAVPVATNETPVGRQKNRRVEIVVKH